MANTDSLAAAITRRGSSGIGECCARVFVQHGAKVVIADIQDELGHTVVEALGKVNSIYVHCDVTYEDHLKDAVDITISAFGKLDIMFSTTLAPSILTSLEFLTT
ncbi:hypothetical protein DCAR_0417616 [Daucus carota subsp. sativus]|uniref:Uncharacterized protein n=1 Tax=Daucus carota subsp. sativus TaxID=79200 RepID=A0A165YT90_DAUCS|nr:hypothetical protein DCAR_0417616 [Daucus carota subsp. sativus]